jgi:pimeloyl-ACP methyl ester carboxylesterase
VRALACAVLVLVATGCGGAPEALDADGGNLPSLRTRCADGQVDAKIGWFRAPDGVLLDGASGGDGKTGVVLAHESPADLCGWIPYARVLSRAGFRVLLFDHRHFGHSQSPTETGKTGRFTRDLEGAVGELKREGAMKVFLMGASFGGVTSMVAGSRLGSKVAGVVSVSGETELVNKYGGPQSELDAVDAVPKLRAPFLILTARDDAYLPRPEARRLERKAGSEHKQLVFFPGGYHGWDLLSFAPYRSRASQILIDFLHRYS